MNATLIPDSYPLHPHPFYPYLYILIIGQYVRYVSALRANLAPGVDAWGYSLKLLMAAIIAGGVGVLSIFEFIQRKVYL
jgi:hypothetical protein